LQEIKSQAKDLQKEEDKYYIEQEKIVMEKEKSPRMFEVERRQKLRQEWGKELRN
jgi:hypothetical protein